MKRYIGCSGYYYNHWKKLFYPENLPKGRWLEYYSDYFSTVEINNTFYRMPDKKSIRNWYSVTPKSFIFSIKGFRFFTHLKKLNIDSNFIDQLNQFQDTISFFKEKTGPLLWQFPRNFNANPEKLDRFCSLLSASFSHVFEFRNLSWYNSEIFSILENHKHDLCMVSGPMTIPDVQKKFSSITYIRFHGEGVWYNDNYSNEALKAWKDKLSKTNTRNLFAYFNNDVNAYAVHNAKYFATLF